MMRRKLYVSTKKIGIITDGKNAGGLGAMRHLFRTLVPHENDRIPKLILDRSAKLFLHLSFDNGLKRFLEFVIADSSARQIPLAESVLKDEKSLLMPQEEFYGDEI